jgi:glycosyltransferase involved in cell wall biosynthesis
VVDLTPRVLHVTDAFPPERGGVERVVDRLAAEQARRGWRVTVLTKAVPGAPSYEQRADGVTVIRYPHAVRPTPWVYTTTWAATRRVTNGLWRSARPDLVHFHLTLSAQGPLTALGDRLPTAASFYGPWFAEFAVEAEPLRASSSRLYGAYLDAQIALQRRWQTRLLDRARRVIVLSEYSREQVARLAPHRAPGAVRIPGGIDAAAFAPAEVSCDRRRALEIPNDGFVIFTVRRLARRMGLDLLLDALALLARDGLAPHALIAGQGPLRTELEAQANRLGLAERVRFLGFVADGDLPDYYRAADLFVVPSRAEENFGLIVLEAAACGAPVAATPVGSLPELLAACESSYAARDASPAALAEVIARAMREPGPAKSREAIAARIRADYAWARIADRLAAVYAELGVG